MSKRSSAKHVDAAGGIDVFRRLEYLSPESQKNLADRLARIEGHVRAVRNMVLEHRCADEVLLQVAAIKAAVNRVAGVIVDQEMKACVKSCMKGSSEERLERMLEVLGTVLKQT